MSLDIMSCGDGGGGGGMRNPEEYHKKVWSNKSMSELYERNWTGMINSLQFGENERVMDYGCGPGTFFSKFMGQIARKKQLKLIGVDISKEMVEYAKQNSHIPGITEYVVANILEVKSWPFNKETFDRVIASNVIHSVEDYKYIFCQFHSCLKIGGTFTAVIPTSIIFKSIRMLRKHPFWSTEYEGGGSKYWGSWLWRDPKKEIPQFEKALISAGFRVREYHHSSVPMVVKDIRECLGVIITANGPLSSIPVGSELYERLVDDLIQNARTFLGNEVDKTPFTCYSDIYYFTGEKIMES